MWSREDRAATEPLEPLHVEDIRSDIPPTEATPIEQKDEK